MAKVRKGFMELMNETYSRFLNLESDEEIINFLKSEIDNLEEANNMIVGSTLYERYKEDGKIESLEKRFASKTTEEKIKSIWIYYVKKLETALNPIEMLQINIVNIPVIYKLTNNIMEN